MPSSLDPAAATDVLPAGLCSAFSEEVRYEMFSNSYVDGSSDRTTLVINPRRFFKLARKLSGPQYTALFDFYKAHLIDPFYFYNPYETAPPFSWDGTGGDPVGRYIVVFDGAWSDAVTLGRSQASFGLREVA